jgi:hypothetical protein
MTNRPSNKLSINQRPIETVVAGPTGNGRGGQAIPIITFLRKETQNFYNFRIHQPALGNFKICDITNWWRMAPIAFFCSRDL